MAGEQVDRPAPPDGPPIPVRTLIRRLLAFAWTHRLLAVPAIVATVAFQLLTLAALSGQGLAIDHLRRRLDPGAPEPRWPFGLAPPEDWSFLAQTALVGAVILLFSVLAAVARFAIRYADELFVQGCVVDLRARLYDKLQRLPFGFFDRWDTGQIINRVTGDAQEVRAFIQGVMIRAGIAVITLAVFLVFMLREHALLTLAVLAVYPVQAGVMLVYSRITKPMFLEQSALVDRVIKSFQESIAGVRVTRVFGRETELLARFDQRSGAARDHRIGIARVTSRYFPFIQASNYLATAVLIGVGGWLVVKGPASGGIALGTLWIFRGLLERLAQQAETIVSIIAETSEALAGAERVFKLLDLPIVVDSRPGAALPDGAIKGDVEFRDVTFGYDPARPVLHSIKFKAHAGETVAVVGPTGAGKSTLLALVSRFYDPQAGSVLIDGVDARDLPLRELRRAVGVVFQEPFLFSHTVSANVAFGDPASSLDAVRAATDAAEATAFIDELPDRFDTVIGERGVSLSGGQRQRLTLARALATKPAILVLDDATGSVDALTESLIQRALDRQMEGRTTFIVAHRLSTLRKADRILVLDKGRIVDSGTHDELMNRPGHYRASALIQLALDEDGRATA